MNNILTLNEIMKSHPAYARISEAQEEPETSKKFSTGKLKLDRNKLDTSVTEHMLRGYGMDSEISNHVRSELKRANPKYKGHRAVYPCYKLVDNSINQFVFYDDDAKRAFEVVRNPGTSDWHVIIGDRNASNAPGAKDDRLAEQLRDNFDAIYKRWKKCAMEDLIKKNHTITGLKEDQKPVWNMLVKILSNLRFVDINKMGKAAFNIESESGEAEKIAAGHASAVNDPMNIIEFEKSFNIRADREYYTSHIGELSMIKPGGKGKSTTMVGSTIAEIIKSMGLNTVEHTKRFNNTELLRIFNNIIQTNPYAAEATKRKWRESLKKIYMEYYMLSTEDVSGAKREYYGPELYDEKVANKYNNPKVRSELRLKLFQLLNNFVLKSEGLGTPDSKAYQKKENAHAGDELRLKSPSRDVMRTESLEVPLFADFVNEAKTSETYIVRFSAPVTKEDLLAIGSVVDAKDMGANRWEITGDYGSTLRPDVEDFAFEKNIDIIAFVEKDEEKKMAPIDIYRQKYRERGSELAGGNRMKDKESRIGARISAQLKQAERFEPGVYVRSEGFMFSEVIFNAIDRLYGYVVLKYNKNTGEYRGRIVPEPSNIKNFMPDEYENTYVLKSEGGYVAYGVQKGGGKIEYYQSRYITGRDVLMFDDKNEAADAANSDIGIECTPVSYAESYAVELKEDYMRTEAKYRENTKNTFYVTQDKEEAAHESGKEPNARSVEALSGNANTLSSFAYELSKALHHAKSHDYAMREMSKERSKQAKESSAAGEYGIIGKNISKEIESDIRSYGKNPEKALSSVPSEYLEKCAEIINSMAEIGVDEETRYSLVSDWQNLAGAAAEATGSEYKASGGNEPRISDDAIAEMKKALANESSLPTMAVFSGSSQEQSANAVNMTVTLAFLQMFVRELGDILIERAISMTKSSREIGEFKSDIEKYVRQDYVDKTSFADLWETYVKQIDNAETGVSKEEAAEARAKLIDIAMVAVDAADGDSSILDDVERDSPLTDDDYAQTKKFLNDLSAAASTKYKNAIASYMKKLYDKKMQEK